MFVCNCNNPSAPISFSMVSPTYSHICVFVFSSCTQILLSLFLSQSLSVCVFLCFLFAEHASSTSFWFSIYSTNLYIYLYIHIYISFSIFIIHVHVFSVFIQVYLITRCNIFSVSVFNKNFFPGFCFDFVYLTTSTTYIFFILFWTIQKRQLHACALIWTINWVIL